MARDCGASRIRRRDFIRTRSSAAWFANLGKRRVKVAKVCVRHTGLLHELLGISAPAALARHLKSGAAWESFALDQILCIASPDAAHFRAIHAGAELDPTMLNDGQRVGIEFKRADAPHSAPSMHIALQDFSHRCARCARCGLPLASGAPGWRIGWRRCRRPRWRREAASEYSRWLRRHSHRHTMEGFSAVVAARIAGPVEVIYRSRPTPLLVFDATYRVPKTK